jgi:hypothetical protein
VAQLIEALRYTPDGSGFDSRWVADIFLWLIPSVRSMALKWWISPRRKSDRYVNLIILSPSCADCLEILGASPSPGAVGAGTGLWRDSYSIYRRTYLTSATTYKVSRNRPHFFTQPTINAEFFKIDCKILKWVHRTNPSMITLGHPINSYYLQQRLRLSQRNSFT